jgi:ketosteroid isomerase-like protein
LENLGGRPAIAAMNRPRAYFGSMHRLFIAFAVALLAAGPAAATDKSDVMSVVHQWVDSFDKGDLKSMAATCTDDASIIDDFPPHEWHGPGTCARWSSDFQDFAKAGDITAPFVTLGKPWHVDITADRAYVVAPTKFSYKQKGSPVLEQGIVIIAMQKGAAGWHITGWAWADH